MKIEDESLTELTEVAGPVGSEGRVRDIIKRELSDHVDTVQRDTVGNLVATATGARDHEVVVTAHMDEIGFLVRHIHDDGFLQLYRNGGLDARILRAQRVTVQTDDGDITGVIGAPPPHAQDERTDYEMDKIEDFYVDLGLPAEEVQELVSVGDTVTLAQSTEHVGETITGKALDNRLSVYVLLQTAKQVSTDATVHYVATAQEEFNLRGANAFSADHSPDVAIVLDVTVANDVPFVTDEADYNTQLGDSTAIKVRDDGVLTNPKLRTRLRTLAEDDGIDYQMDVATGFHTDTKHFQTANGAVPVGALSIPTRYLHTPVETAHETDILATQSLLSSFLRTEDGTHDYTL